MCAPSMFLVLCLALGIMVSGSVSGQPSARASDLYYTDITPVTDETRYTTLNPDIQLNEMNKVKHSKGNIVFTAGERASGDRMIVNHFDGDSLTSAKDVEVLMSYPAGASTGVTITSIEVYVDMLADDAGGYLTKGGIGQTNVEILLTSNQTRSFVYETFIYGY